MGERSQFATWPGESKTKYSVHTSMSHISRYNLPTVAKEYRLHYHKSNQYLGSRTLEEFIL